MGSLFRRAVFRVLFVGALLFASGCASVQRRGPPVPTAAPSDGSTLFVVFDIGQADAMLVLHRGKALLVDAGVSLRKKDAEKYREIPRRLEVRIPDQADH